MADASKRVGIHAQGADLRDIGDRYADLAGQAMQATSRGDNRTAVKLFEKAIKLRPNDSPAYIMLATVYSSSGSKTKAVPLYLKAMEVAEQEWQHADPELRGHARVDWAKGLGSAFMCLVDPSCQAAVPPWYHDIQQLKLLANRAVSVAPGLTSVLLMRVMVCEMQEDPSADELRQALRDYQLLAGHVPEGRGGAEKDMERVRDKLRARIAADIAASSGAVHALQISE